MSNSTPLRQFREELTDPKVSQEYLAREAGVTLQTYRNAESGKNCTYTTATSILDALNSERQARGKRLLSLDQLGLSIV